MAGNESWSDGLEFGHLTTTDSDPQRLSAACDKGAREGYVA